MEPSECHHSSVDEFKIVKSLGAGLHAKVKLATYQGKQYAIKIFKPDTADLSNLEHELEILKTLDHPNIIRLTGVRPKATYKKKSGKTREALVIILEFASGGELFDYVALCGKFSTEIARTYFHMLIDALAYIHSKGICHRDIKPENILLDNEFRLRLADFGFATFLKRGTLTTKLGTQGYMAPEIRSKSYKGEKVDLFAAGIILFVMFAGGPPFEKAVPNDPYYKVFAAKQYNIFWGAHAKRKPAGFFTDDFKDLINKMLCLKPQQRIDIEGIRNHPWYRGDVLFLNDMQEDLMERKRKIEEKKQEQNASSNSSESRSGLEKPSLETLIEIKNQIKFDEHSMTREFESVGNKDLVLQTDAATFVANLKFMLTHGDGNRIFRNENEDAPPINEFYNVQINPTKQTVDIRLTHNEIETNVHCLIRLKLGYDDKKNLVVRFIRELDETDQQQPFDYLLSVRLVNFIKDTLRTFSA